MSAESRRCAGPPLLPDGERCGRPPHVPGLALCTGHLAQVARGEALTSLAQECSAPGDDGRPCGRLVRSRGLCEGHYAQVLTGRELAPLRPMPSRYTGILTFQARPEATAAMAQLAQARVVSLSELLRQAVDAYLAAPSSTSQEPPVPRKPKAPPPPSPGDHPGRGNTLADALAALRLLLAPGQHTVEDVAEAARCGRRQAYRLVEALESAGVEVRSEREGRHVHLWVDEDSVLRALGLEDA